MNEIVVIMPQGGEQLCSILSAAYKVRAQIPSAWDYIAAVLVDIDHAEEQGLLIAEQLKEHTSFTNIPILGLTFRLPEEQDAAWLERGFFDLIQLPCPPPLLLKRIGNAIRASDSVTFHEMERMLKQLPSNIFLKDAEGRYVFSTQIWHHLYHSDDPNWSIRGKTDLEIRKDKQNAQRAMEADREILRTGKGTNYIIEEKSDGADEFLELIKRPVYDRNGKISGIIALINNVTEQHMLKMELEKRSQIDPLTELLNRRTTENHIRLTLEQGQKGWERGALMMIDVDNFKGVNDSQGHAVGDSVLIDIAKIIRTNFRVMDVTGRTGGDEFMVFLRDIADRDAACRSVERFQEQVRAAFQEIGGVSISIGIALYPEHGKTFDALYRAADKALYDVKREGKGIYKFYCPEESLPRQ